MSSESFADKKCFIPLFLFFLSCSHPGKPPRQHIFVDIGSARGQVIEDFKKTRMYRDVPWKIFAIEPSTDTYPLIPKAPDVTLIPKAAWLYDGQIEFFKTTDEGKTRNSVYHSPALNNEKVTWECFDFSQWIRKNFRKEDYVIVSLDIAGAEADLLERMLEDGTIDLVDRAYVEFSVEMISESGSPAEDEQLRRIHSLVENIRGRGILFDSDSAEDVITKRQTWIDEI